MISKSYPGTCKSIEYGMGPDRYVLVIKVPVEVV